MDASRWLHKNELYALVCRPALPMDTPGVLDLTRTIWGGEDYVPSVWDEWLADPQGLLAVAEYGGRVVGLAKLSRLSPIEWWLQGLRVHPERQGQGFASRLFDYVYDYWQRKAGGTLRLATASFRKPVHHLCERAGFRKVGEFSIFIERLGVSAGQAPDPGLFAPLDAAGIPAALELIRRSSSVRLSFGLMELGWEWAEASE